jgi:hypothetical protein
MEQLNLRLRDDKRKLEANLRTVSAARVLRQEVDFGEFRAQYPDEDACYAFLEGLKWEGGYACKKCGHGSYSGGKTPRSRRCTRCGYDESVTAFTVFFRLKFPLVKAFYITYLVSANPRITSEELSRALSLRLNTCRAFKNKILAAIREKELGRRRSGAWSDLVADPTPVAKGAEKDCE